MKKILSFAIIAVLAMVACSKSNNETPAVSGTLSVTSSQQLQVGFYGGEGTITYTITNGSANAKPTATSNVGWVNNIEVAEAITFNVDMNNTTEKRVATIVVSYGEQAVNVFVSQDAGYEIDVEFVATALNGEYYGTNYSPDPNYFAILSKNGTTGYQDLYLDSYYRLDLYSKTPAGDPVMLPEGVYPFDYLDQGFGSSLGNSYSLLFQTFENGSYKENPFDDGVVIVTENKVEAILVLRSGEVHHVVYEGSLELGYIEIPEPDYYTTLTDDYSFSHKDGILRVVNYGDYYGVGGSNWSVSMVLPGEPINGDYFLLDITTDSVSTDPDNIIGTYTCVADEESVTKNCFIAGTKNGTEYLFSWYQVVVDNYIDHSQVAPLVGGTITIEKEGTGYILTYDCVDDLGHKIQGTFTCANLEVYEG